MIVHAAESLYWFNTTEPPYLIKGLPISLESRHTTLTGIVNYGPAYVQKHRSTIAHPGSVCTQERSAARRARV